MKKLIFILLTLAFVIAIYFISPLQNTNLPTVEPDELATKNLLPKPSPKPLPKLSTTPLNEGNKQVNKHEAYAKSTPESYISCLPDANFDQEKYTSQVNDYVNSLAESENILDRLFNALFAANDALAVNEEQEQVQENSNEVFEYTDHFTPAIALSALAKCAATGNKNCTDDFLNLATKNDNLNGAAWFYSAIANAKSNNSDAVVQAINEIANTAYFNERLGEQALLYAETLAATEHNNFIENAFTGFEKATGNLPDYSPIIQWCNSNTDQQANTMACLSLGKQLTERSQVLLTQLVGITLQKNAHNQMNNTDAVEQLTELQKGLLSTSSDPTSDKALQMIMLDESLMRRWLTLMDNYGEGETHRLLVEEVQQAYSSKQTLLCAEIRELLAG